MVEGFLGLIFDSILPGKCLRCDASISPPDPDDCFVIPHKWPPETFEFLRTDFYMHLLRGFPIPARILCSRCWLTLEPAFGVAELSLYREPERPAGSHRGRVRHSGNLGCTQSTVPLVTPFYTNDVLLEVVHFLKFSSGRTAAPPLSWWLAFSLSCFREIRRPGGFVQPLVIPVPLHPSRRRSRGYNQAAILAECTAARLGFDCNPTVLRRIRKTKPQANLEPEERVDNVRGAFALVHSGTIRGRDVIVVDDLVTTAETVRACVTAVRRGSPASVIVLAVGRPRSLESKRLV